MQRWFWNRLIAAGFAGIFCAVPVSLLADDSTNIGLDEIARRLTQWRASFVNLRLVWELRSLPESDEPVVDWPPPPDPDSGALFCRKEWIWADHGLDFLEDHSFFYEDGSSKVHIVEAFNGPKGVVFRALFHKPAGGPEEFKALHLKGLGVGKPTSSIERTPVSGLYRPGHAAWLPELLAKWEWKLEKIEDVGGDPCARVAALTDDGRWFETLWLDVNHDCLVRRRTAMVSGKRTGFDVVIDEFQTLAGGIWFPKRGRIQLMPLGREGASVPNENQMFVVTEAVTNQPLDLSRFDPPSPQVGTVVDDHGRPYRHGISGSGAGEGAIKSTAVEAGSRSPSAAPPRPGWFWSGVLISIAVVLLLAGLWFSPRKKGA